MPTRRLLLLFSVILPSIACAQSQTARTTIPLSGDGWYLTRDEKAAWQDDQLYLPEEAKDLSKLPVNPPSGGWQTLTAKSAKAVSVPGTVEEYLATSDYPRNEAFLGVSWWFRSLTVPLSLVDKKILLRFEAVRQRAEVYLDGKLVAYDIIGETPFEADITPFVTPGKGQSLAVRVTSPGGNFHWQDFNLLKWGKYLIPPGRSFSGILGRVNLVAVNPVYIADIYMQNTPKITSANAIVTVRNLGIQAVRQNLAVSVLNSANGTAGQLLNKQLENVDLPPGDTTLTVELNAARAKVWDLSHPNLYTCQVSLANGNTITDQDRQTFGFRWFAPEDVGSNAVLRLNGRRIMLRSAISWGYWPVTGLVPTPEMAEKQVTTAKELGLNMLNFHRNIGSPIVLETADRLGLLYYEEPGGYQSIKEVPSFAHSLIREKIMRMVRRDRSHPSLVIYNLINEYGNSAVNKDIYGKRMDDMRDAHSLDPSRSITFTSGWAGKKDAEEDSKANMRPFDTALYRNGWFDNHRAGGPETWLESYYKSPTENLMYTDNNTEIYMRGEEGALSTPPRIEKIHADLAGKQYPGWDGLFWEKQYAAFQKMFEEKNLKPYFGSIDRLTELMGNISFEHQGRRIEGMRMQNLGDCYVVNGWESMPFDNHSGIVDIFRNPKGDPSLLAYYNQPAYIAVAPRKQVLRLPSEVPVDFYAVNEINLKGDYTLHITVSDPGDKEVFSTDKPVTLAGGEIYGQLLVENLPLTLGKSGGLYTIKASLLDANKKECINGHDQVLGVDWNAKSLGGNGAVYDYENSSKLRPFFKQKTGHELPSFDSKMGKLDWLIVARPPLDSPQTIDASAFQTPDGKPGLNLTFFKNTELADQAGQRVDNKLDINFSDGAQPDSSLAAGRPFSVIWEGKLIPPASGNYLLAVTTDNGVRLYVNNQRTVDEWDNKKASSFERSITMETGKPVNIRLEYRQTSKTGMAQLQWSIPGSAALDPKVIFDRVKNDGTTLIIPAAAVTWLDTIAKYTGIKQDGSFSVGKDWVGGVHFVKKHPLFKELPVNTGMGWPYQAVVRDGNHRLGLKLGGEELVAGAYRSFPFNLGTAVGVIPCGKGRIIVSTLDICDNLDQSTGPADVARKLLCNYLDFAREQ
ncbi:MAG: hypothetical protein LBH01_03495 [Verrucomicrobiales bacterium]|jgi:hypothetical protein|nr:hypothetical protein [Verrucomicrobiales bacterium]